MTNSVNIPPAPAAVGAEVTNPAAWVHWRHGKITRISALGVDVTVRWEDGSESTHPKDNLFYWSGPRRIWPPKREP